MKKTLILFAILLLGIPSLTYASVINPNLPSPPTTISATGVSTASGNSGNYGSGPLRQVNNINDLGVKISDIINTVIYLLVALAVVFIVYNVVIYFIRPSDSGERAKAGMSILWGLVGLFIIVSLWGLVAILVNTFATNNTAPKDNFPSADFVNE